MYKIVDGEEIELTAEEIAVMEEKRKEHQNSIEYRIKQINKLKQKLSDTDYIVIKIAEGVATTEEYADVIAKRQEWREQINILEFLI